MKKYWHVILTYLTRKLALFGIFVWSFFCICFLVNILNKSGEVQAIVLPQIFMGVAFPSFFIGAHLKQQIASHRASLVPGFRAPHLIVAGCLLAVLMSIPLIVSWAAGACVSAVMALCGMAWVLAVYLGASPGVLPILGYIVVVLCAVLPSWRGVVMEIFAGRQPWLVGATLSAEAAAAVLHVDHLMRLKEDDPDFGKVQPLNVWDFRAGTVRNQQRAQTQSFGWMMATFFAPTSWHLDRITRQCAATRSQRVALFRLADTWPTNPWFSTLIIGVVEVFIVIESQSTLNSEKAFRGAMSIALFFSFALVWANWVPVLHRWPRLAYESLRPVTRREWVIENGLAILRNVGAQLGLWAVLQVALLLIFLPQFSTSPALLEGIAWAIGGQFWIFGTSAWLASFGSMSLKFIGMVVSFSLLMPVMLLTNVAPQLESVPMGYILGLVGSLVGVITAKLAFRRWCMIDLP